MKKKALVNTAAIFLSVFGIIALGLALIVFFGNIGVIIDVVAFVVGFLLYVGYLIYTGILYMYEMEDDNV